MDASASVTTAAVVKGTSYFFYTSLLAFVIFLIMLAIHYYVKPFLPFVTSSPVIKDSVAADIYDNVLLYNNIKTDNPAPANTALELTKDIASKPDNFTLSFDCYLNGTYLSTDVPRVLFYFGTNAVSIADNNALKEYKGDSEKETPRLLDNNTSDLISKFPHTNFIVYADPVKNDLKIGVYTIDPTSSHTVRLEIASIIKNIPIRQVFQVTIVLTPRFIEVYMNKKLVNTYTIGSLSPKVVVNSRTEVSNLNTVLAESTIYTPISFIRDTIKVANINFYNGPLTSSQIRNLIKPSLPNGFFN